MDTFWVGFEKRAYDYEHEVGKLKKHYEEKSKASPRSKWDSGRVGAGLGAVAGAGLGAMGMGIGPGTTTIGAAAGGGLGVLSAVLSKMQIENAKKIVAMPPEEQRAYLKHLARKEELASSLYY